VYASRTLVRNYTIICINPRQVGGLRCKGTKARERKEGGKNEQCCCYAQIMCFMCKAGDDKFGFREERGSGGGGAG
jgi:hypothetical protein